MAVMGVGFGIGTGFLVNRLAKIFPLRGIYLSCTLLSGIFVLVMLLVPGSLIYWLMVAPLACMIAVSYTSILTLFSNAVDESKQGWVMGVTGSILALDWAVNGILVGMVAAWNPLWPIIISTVVLIFAGLIGFLYKS